MVRFSVYVVWPSVLSLNYFKVLKIHKTKAMKNICIQEKFIYFIYLFYLLFYLFIYFIIFILLCPRILARILPSLKSARTSLTVSFTRCFLLVNWDQTQFVRKSLIIFNYVILACFFIVLLKVAQNSFQHLYLHGTLQPFFITWCYNHGINKLPDHW